MHCVIVVITVFIALFFSALLKFIQLFGCPAVKGKGKGKGRYSSSWEPHLRATGRHLPYGITQCYLSPDTS